MGLPPLLLLNQCTSDVHAVTAERSSFHEDTITAIGLINDGMSHSGKSASNIEVTNDMMIHRTRSAHTKYKAFLEEQKKEQELKAQKKKAADST